MEPVKVYFGTVKPIRYQELDERIGLDIDVDCRIKGSVNVTEYPEEYSNEETLKEAVKETAVAALTEYLHDLPKKNFGRSFYSYSSRDELLKKAVEEALSEKGIRAEAVIDGFTLDADSEEAIKKYREELCKPLMYVDEWNKPKEWEKTMAAVYAGPAQMPPQMMMVYAGPSQMNGGNGAFNGMNMILAQQQLNAQKEKEKNETKKQTGEYCFCPACGYCSKPYRFCPECGNTLKDAVLYRDCPACGNRVPAKDRFCRECGKAFGEEGSSECTD